MSILDYNKLSLEMHENKKGKIEVISKVSVKTRDDLSTAYTPGVAEPCRRIHENKSDVYKYTSKGNLVAVVSDGTAVLGLGNIGPEAAMPVMEGKAILFKEFAGVDAFPICLDTTDVEEIVKTVKYLAPTFGGINLEDIGAPRCFEIERRLKEELDIPVFHDDQHGTAIVVAAGLINALKLVGKEMENINVVINGAGSAGISICKLLLQFGVGNVVLVNREGAVAIGETWMNEAQSTMAQITNKDNERGLLTEIIKNKDVFIGVSGPNCVTSDMVSTMSKDAIVFAMANPTPEIMPDEAKKGGARVIATGRSDFPNQINNVLVFPGIFRGALDVQATDITEEMKVAAAKAIASIINAEELNEEYIIPGAFDTRVADVVAREVATVAIEAGISKIHNNVELCLENH
ncbi:MAG: NAD(P)-dependent malic enzyme [Peptostreptococcaceae bacterium]